MCLSPGVPQAYKTYFVLFRPRAHGALAGFSVVPGVACRNITGAVLRRQRHLYVRQGRPLTTGHYKLAH